MEQTDSIKKPIAPKISLILTILHFFGIILGVASIGINYLLKVSVPFLFVFGLLSFVFALVLRPRKKPLVIVNSLLFAFGSMVFLLTSFKLFQDIEEENAEKNARYYSTIKYVKKEMSKNIPGEDEELINKFFEIDFASHNQCVGPYRAHAGSRDEETYSKPSEPCIFLYKVPYSRVYLYEDCSGICIYSGVRAPGVSLDTLWCHSKYACSVEDGLALKTMAEARMQ